MIREESAQTELVLKAIPVSRHGILVALDRPISLPEAEAHAYQIIEEWPLLQDSFHSFLGGYSPAVRIDPIQEPTVSREGNDIVLDLPQAIGTLSNGIAFSNKVTFATCADGKNAAYISTLASPFDVRQEQYAETAIGETYGPCITGYRQLAEASAQWAFENLSNTDILSASSKRSLEATVIGIRENDGARLLFDYFRMEGPSAQDLFHISGAEDEILQYLRPLVPELQKPLAGYAGLGQSSQWARSTAVAEVIEIEDHGEYVPMDVLYLVSPSADQPQRAIGVCYDPSSDGSLASRSSEKLIKHASRLV